MENNANKFHQEIFGKPVKNKSNIQDDLLEFVLKKDSICNPNRTRADSIIFYKIATQKIGNFMQEILALESVSTSHYGDKSRCDLINNDRNFVLELKNRINTDNSSSFETNCKKLINIQKKAD